MNPDRQINVLGDVLYALTLAEIKFAENNHAGKDLC